MKNRNLLISFKNAFRGLFISYIRERNFRIQISFAILAIYFSIKFKIDKVYFLFILLAIFLVLSFEMINSALEILGDKIEEKYDEKIRDMKDTLAGGVLLFSIFSIILGMIVFIRYIKDLDLFSIIFSIFILILPFLVKDKNDIIKKRGDE